MTKARLGIVPAQLAADDEPQAARALVAVPEPSGAAPADMVLLPREVAEAAYSLVKAITALKNDGGLALFSALGRALDKAPGRDETTPPACAVCGVEIHHGLAHDAGCTSDDAVRHRSATVPGFAAGDT